MSQLSKKASAEMDAWILAQGGYQAVQFEDAIAMAYSISKKYGEASASLSAIMYDAIAEASGAPVADRKSVV